MSTQSDCELLELAAKAAGFTRFDYCETSGDEPHLYVYEPPIGMWSSLADDGDALRLLIQLRLVVEWWKNGVSAYSQETVPDAIQHFGGDAMAATRRAVTRAAASIGAALKAEGGEG